MVLKRPGAPSAEPGSCIECLLIPRIVIGSSKWPTIPARRDGHEAFRESRRKEATGMCACFGSAVCAVAGVCSRNQIYGFAFPSELGLRLALLTSLAASATPSSHRMASCGSNSPRRAVMVMGVESECLALNGRRR